MKNNLDETSQKLIEQLSEVRDEFIKNKKDLAVSIRKDLVAVELRELLSSNLTYDELKIALETYIAGLLKIEM